MLPPSLPDDIRDLSIPDRIELATAIWESVAEDPGKIALSEEQKKEIDRRLALRENDPNAGEAWTAIRQRLLTKR